MVECKACVMKGRGRRPPHANCCSKKQNIYKKQYETGYEFLSYNDLYKVLYNGQKVPFPKDLKKKPTGFKNGLRNKITEVMVNVQEEGHKPKKVIKPELQPIMNKIFRPKGIMQLNNVQNSNKNNIHSFLHSKADYDEIEPLFKWVGYKYRSAIYKKPKHITLYVKRNGSIDTQNDMFSTKEAKDYKTKVEKAKKANKRFLIYQVHLLFDIDDQTGKSPSNQSWTNSSGYHMNLFVHDLARNTMFRIEPYGTSSHRTNHYLDSFLKKTFKTKGVKYIKSENVMPFKGPMFYYEPSFFSSSLWCLAFMQYLLEFPNMHTNAIFKSLGLRKKSSHEFMSKYVKYLIGEMKRKDVLR